MVSRKEYQQRAEECLVLANEATEVYVKVALSELATEFQKIADGVEPEPRAGTRKQASHKGVAHKRAA
jgi:dsDNA-specific endonuclease/ATPase MutS2